MEAPRKNLRRSRSSMLKLYVFPCRFYHTQTNRLVSQLEDTDNFENWEKLVRAAETLEGGLNRNSSPQAIATTRDAYDRFLAKFPLLFGYWKKYADLEFNISGPESAEMVSASDCSFGCWDALLTRV